MVSKKETILSRFSSEQRAHSPRQSTKTAKCKDKVGAKNGTCCIWGCDRPSTNRRKGSLKTPEAYSYEEGHQQICSYHYFSSLYNHKRSTGERPIHSKRACRSKRVSHDSDTEDEDSKQSTESDTDDESDAEPIHKPQFIVVPSTPFMIPNPVTPSPRISSMWPADETLDAIGITELHHFFE